MASRGNYANMLNQIINCDELGWGFKLLSCLENETNAELVNCDSNVHAELCRQLAANFAMLLDIYPETKSVRFTSPVDGESRADPECTVRMPNPFGGQDMLRVAA